MKNYISTEREFTCFCVLMVLLVVFFVFISSQRLKTKAECLALGYPNAHYIIFADVPRYCSKRVNGSDVVYEL